MNWSIRRPKTEKFGGVEQTAREPRGGEAGGRDCDADATKWCRDTDYRPNNRMARGQEGRACAESRRQRRRVRVEVWTKQGRRGGERGGSRRARFLCAAAKWQVCKHRTGRRGGRPRLWAHKGGSAKSVEEEVEFSKPVQGRPQQSRRVKTQRCCLQGQGHGRRPGKEAHSC